MAGPYSLVVRGDVVTPAGLLPDGWVAVRDGKIAAIGEGVPPAAIDFHEARGSLVLPGVIDGQTHAGSQFGFKGLGPTTCSAVAGGVTTIVDMPYDEPEPLHNLDIFKQKAEAIGHHAFCDVALYGTILGEGDLGEVTKLAEAGVCGFKISSFENHPARFPRITNDRALTLMEILAETDIPIGLHNEDQDIVRAKLAVLKASGVMEGKYHSPSRPEVAELVATVAFLEMGKASGAHVHLVHLSSPRGFEIVRRYQQDGTRATGEMCVHYLHFDAAEDMARLGALMKVNPPIRDGARDGLWDELFLDGAEFVSSDHSAWSHASKLSPSIFNVPAGIPGLETLLPVFFSDLKTRGEDAPMLAAQYLSERPARFFGLWPRKGAIAVGADADLVVFTPGETVFDAATTHDGLNWSPYDGETFAGRASATFVRGRLMWDGRDVTAAPGYGRFVPRIRTNA